MRGRLIWRLFWGAVFLPGIAVSQNLIPNGGFENFRNCPRQDNVLEEATPWANPNRATPDFYHQCFPTVQMVLPPRSGQGLARLFLDLNWAEYLSAPLTEPLKANECYYFEMYISIESPAKYIPQSMGAHFSAQPLTATTTGLLSARPQVVDYQLNKSTKPLQWELVAGYILPKGGERYVTIGSFNKLPDFLGFHYLFIDDISLTRVKVDLGKDTTLCGRASTHVLNAKMPGATAYRWNDGSTAPTLTVTKPGKYWVDVTTPCKAVSDTITVKYALDFDLGADTTLCQGQTLRLQTPTDATTIRWQDGSSQPTYQVGQAGTFSVRAAQPGCAVTDSIRVRYILPPRLDLGPDKDLCVGESFTIKPSFAEGTFAWQDGFTEIPRTVRNTAVFRATVRNECATINDSLIVQSGACGCIVYAPDIFTPNADGFNDDFVPLPGCDGIALTSLAIFNRWGELIFQTDAPPFQWNGFCRGEICPDAVYAWRLTYQLAQKGKISLERKEGAVRLVR
ncbi:MAG: gliding motility-associated C-terminal domain-containing protein [Cytophagaceae bacterium]|nr:gliding motility-associated C-terminal domain-containing protein [Cytophagaceae bacterium]